MNLVVNNKVIYAPISTILDRICLETGRNLFQSRVNKGANLVVTCPNHKDGKEKHPSCGIYQNMDDPKVEYGRVHCFSCGYNVPLYQMVADCFNISKEDGKEWLSERFGDIIDNGPDILPPLEIEKERPVYLDESILNDFNFYHPYMKKRKLEDWVINKFQIGSTRDGKCITFPIRDEKGRLVGISRRSTVGKFFELPKFKNKPIYLFDAVRYSTYPFILICEAQIDALTSWGYGVPAVALLGTGSSYQFDILNRSGIRSYVTFFDNDEAGQKATLRFNKNIRKDVSVINLNCSSTGKKDINDLTKEEFNSILLKEGLVWRLPDCI